MENFIAWLDSSSINPIILLVMVYFFKPFHFDISLNTEVGRKDINLSGKKKEE